MTTYSITMHVYLYPEYDELSLNDMQSSELVKDTYHKCVGRIGHYLSEVGLHNDLFYTSFDYDTTKDVVEIVGPTENGLYFKISIGIVNKICDRPTTDLYRDKKVSEGRDDIEWYPAYVQLNNLRIKSQYRDSTNVALVFARELIKSVTYLTPQNINQGVVIHDNKFSFDSNYLEASQYAILKGAFV